MTLQGGACKPYRGPVGDPGYGYGRGYGYGYSLPAALHNTGRRL
jgi:hypothetical protein